MDHDTEKEEAKVLFTVSSMKSLKRVIKRMKKLVIFQNLEQKNEDPFEMKFVSFGVDHNPVPKPELLQRQSEAESQRKQVEAD